MNKSKLLTFSELEPLCILRTLIRNFWLIILAVLIGYFSASAILTGDVSRSYSSSATFVVTPQGSSYYNQISAAASSAETYAELLSSDLMQRVVTASLDGKYSGTISASQIGQTNLISVNVTADTPAAALLVMQALTEEYEVLSQYVSSSATLSVLNTPSLSTLVRSTFNSRSLTRNAAIGCGGAMVVILVMMNLYSGTVQNVQGAKNRVDGKLLGTIPHEKKLGAWILGPRRNKRRLNVTSPNISFGFAESIHRIAEAFEREKSAGKTVFLLTSVSETEGKSTVAANLALSLSMKRHRVLFLDLDLRRPVQSHYFGIKVAPEDELGAMLKSKLAPQRILRQAIPYQDTSMYTLLSQRSYPTAAELIASDTLARLLLLAREQYDYVIIDLPPIGYFSEGEALIDQADASVLVVRQDVVPADVINDCIDSLQAGQADFMGFILNDVNTLTASDSGYGYGYGKYGYGKYGYGSYHSGKSSTKKPGYHFTNDSTIDPQEK